jgi:hypothetical protein
VIASGDGDMFRSPSLQALDRALGPAFELKFLVDEAKAGEVEVWARQRLSLDPHGDSTRGGAYHTTTLYLDTAELDVYHRTPSFRRRKFRVRRYGHMPWVYLERKTKFGDRVSKRRARIPEIEIERLGNTFGDPSWAGSWFLQRISAKRLLPAFRIAYDRTAYVGACAEGPLRLTIDRNVCGNPFGQWLVSDSGDSREVLPSKAILELKFLRAMPLPFKDLVQTTRLNPAIVSKYRLCREAWGVPARGQIETSRA